MDYLKVNIRLVVGNIKQFKQPISLLFCRSLLSKAHTILGKTTLFKSLIAQQITARAIAIIEDKDQSLNMLVCSTAIKAVDNVIADLKREKFT